MQTFNSISVLSDQMGAGVGGGLLFQNNPQNVYPSDKMDLDFFGCFRRENL